MNYSELVSYVLAACPNAIFDEVDGELTISTGLALFGEDGLVNLEEAE